MALEFPRDGNTILRSFRQGGGMALLCLEFPWVNLKKMKNSRGFLKSMPSIPPACLISGIAYAVISRCLKNKAVPRVPVPATIILKFAVPVVFKIRNSKVYR